MPSPESEMPARSILQYFTVPKYEHVLCLLVSLVLCIALIGRHISLADGLLQTVTLTFFVTLGGLALINRMSLKLRDYRLQNLIYIYLIKLAFVLLVLYFIWVPSLDTYVPYSVYDPQRYYFEAFSLFKGGFSTIALPSLNYTGILYYYGLLFAVMGHNPFAPAIVNVFVTLLATLLVVRVGYLIKQERGQRDWMLGLGMVIPEVLWFDALTARETLSMALYTLCTLAAAVNYVSKPGDRSSFRQNLVVILSLLLLGLIRTSLLIPAVITIFFLHVSLRKRSRRSFLIPVAICISILLFVPVLSERLGSYQFEYIEKIRWITSRDETFLSSVTWSERSVGRLLIPDNLFEAAAFAPVRLLFYLVAPLPTISVDPAGFVSGNWEDWQYLMAILSALLYIILFPLAVASLIQALRHKKAKAQLAFHLPFWWIMIAIAAGNQIISERYRVMAVLLLWGCIWLGKSCPERLVHRVYCGWLGMLALGGLFYYTYKFLL